MTAELFLPLVTILRLLYAEKPTIKTEIWTLENKIETIFKSEKIP